MNRIECFKARLDATMSPVDVMYKMRSDPEGICVVDFRNGPATLLIDRRARGVQTTCDDFALNALDPTTADRAVTRKVKSFFSVLCDLP
jgi:hypothetical protein